MRAFTFTDVNAAYAALVPWFLDQVDREVPAPEFSRTDSRNGPVVRLRGPVGVTYADPTSRVLLDADRDANPFFHLYEAAWMLLGRNDVEGVAKYVKGMKNFSDDGETLHGAYGHRWRHRFGYDQLPVIAEELRKNPESRRCVLQIWDATRSGVETVEVETIADPTPKTFPAFVGSPSDLDMAVGGGADVPCNCAAFFEVDDGRLNMTVCNRSNDLVWGALGANYVHFTVLQSYMAWLVGVPVGTYAQFSNNLHLYAELYGRRMNPGPGVYVVLSKSPSPVFHRPWDSGEREGTVESVRAADGLFSDRLRKTVEVSERGLSFAESTGFPWLDFTLSPALAAHAHHRAGRSEEALFSAHGIVCPHWRSACVGWLKRRRPGPA